LVIFIRHGYGCQALLPDFLSMQLRFFDKIICDRIIMKKILIILFLISFFPLYGAEKKEKPGIEDVKLPSINFEDASIGGMGFKFLFNGIRRSYEASLNPGLGNCIIWLPEEKSEAKCTFKMENVSLRKVLDEISKQTGIQYKADKNAILIAEKIKEDKNSKKLTPLDKVILEYVELEEATLSCNG